MGSSGSMTSAGIGAVYMALDKLSEGDATVDGEKMMCCGAQEVDKSIDRALAWMGRNFSVATNPGTGRSQTYLLYYLYGMERVGRLSNAGQPFGRPAARHPGCPPSPAGRA